MRRGKSGHSTEETERQCKEFDAVLEKETDAKIRDIRNELEKEKDSRLAALKEDTEQHLVHLDSFYKRDRITSVFPKNFSKKLLQLNSDE